MIIDSDSAKMQMKCPVRSKGKVERRCLGILCMVWERVPSEDDGYYDEIGYCGLAPNDHGKHIGAGPRIGAKMYTWNGTDVVETEG